MALILLHLRPPAPVDEEEDEDEEEVDDDEEEEDEVEGSRSIGGSLSWKIQVTTNCFSRDVPIKHNAFSSKRIAKKEGGRRGERFESSGQTFFQKKRSFRRVTSFSEPFICLDRRGSVSSWQQQQ